MERPILFSGPMVRALLRDVDPKWQTRRILKLPPWVEDVDRAVYHLREMAKAGEPPGLAEYVDGRPRRRFTCPYGGRGDRLWVRETWAPCDADGTPFVYAADADEDGRVPYLVSGAGGLGGGVGSFRPERWHPSIHMHRRASRISLDVTGVRLERLQDIGEEDAKAEGVEPLDSEREEHDWSICAQCGGTRLYTALGPNLGACPDTDCTKCDTYRKRFRLLWEHINGAESWDANPWVWVVEFKSIEPAKEPG